MPVVLKHLIKTRKYNIIKQEEPFLCEQETLLSFGNCFYKT